MYDLTPNAEKGPFNGFFSTSSNLLNNNSNNVKRFHTSLSGGVCGGV